jgi:HAMP domain-containing protein
VCPIQSATGKRYVAISTVFEKATRPLRVRFWFNLAIAMVPAALVCMLLSLYLTRPISRLRATAQRLAGGDLSARAAPTGIIRNDELRDLARDFECHGCANSAADHRATPVCY